MRQARPPPAHGDPGLAGAEDPQPGAEDLREQRVVAVPPPLVVERDDEQVRALELLQSRLAVRAAGDRIAERSAHAVEERGPQEEVLGLGRQAAEDLLDDVVEDETVAGAEPPHLPGLVGPAAQGDRGQAQHRSPALGARDERGDGRGVELHRHRSEHLAGLGLSEAEVPCPHFQQLAPRTESGQRQRRVGARCDRHPRPGREPLDERRDKAMDRRLLDHVVVVQHQHHLASDPIRERGGNRVEDAGERELRVDGLGRVALGDHLDPAREVARSGREVSDEADHVVVARVERKPRAADVRLARP